VPDGGGMPRPTRSVHGGTNLFAYVFDNPQTLTDPHGLCAKNAALSNCDSGDSGCCVAKAVDGLRFSRCLDKEQQNTFTNRGALMGAMSGIGLRPKTPVGMCASGGVGTAVGAIGFFEGYYGYEWAISKAAQWNAFKNKMADCGAPCIPTVAGQPSQKKPLLY
jgi:hypothetical protein